MVRRRFVRVGGTAVPRGATRGSEDVVTGLLLDVLLPPSCVEEVLPFAAG